MRRDVGRLATHLPWLLTAGVALYLLLCLRDPPGPGMRIRDFAGLPVLHNGRLKPIDTIARTTLLALRGKQSAPAGDRRLSPAEWLLDVAAAPEKADGYRVFLIDDPDVLGLMGKKQEQGRYYSLDDISPSLRPIEFQAGQAGQVPAAARTRFQAAIAHLQERLALYQRLKNTLQVSGTEDFPLEIAAYDRAIGPGLKAIQRHQRADRFDRKALAELGSFFDRYRFLSQAAEFRPVPPLEGASPEAWSDMGAALLERMRPGAPHPAIAAYAALLRAYRSKDAPAFNGALADYRRWLASGRGKALTLARYEEIFNRFEPFYQGMVVYMAVLILAFASWLLRPELLQRCAFHLLLLALAVHTGGLAMRILLQGRPPVTNLYSSAVFVGWVAVVLGAFLERLHRNGLGSAVSAAVGFSTLLVAHHLTGQGDTMEMMRAVLDSNFWLGTHVVTITIGYGATFLAGALAHAYILSGVFTSGLRRPAAKSLASMTYGVVCFSLLFSFVGTVLGGIWADQSWGRFWGWDPKENGALLIVLWDALILHARWGGFVRERGIMVLAVFGNIITSLSWFGVNMLGIGLHSYGFMDKAFWWLMLFVGIELAVASLASLPPRLWRSFRDEARA